MFHKLIEMQFVRSGKRTKLVGFVGELRDESGIVLHSRVYDTKPEAELALDRLTHDLLTDHFERGLVDTLPEPVAAERTIHYTHRRSDFTQDVYIEGCWVASATCNHAGEEVADEVQYRELDGGQPDAYTLAADAGAFGPQAPAWDINNSEYCPKHETWFGRMPCPECYTEARQPSDDDVPEGTTCQYGLCMQPATHCFDARVCCCHCLDNYTGMGCTCTDDDYADAAWESDHGSYNGKVPSDFTDEPPEYGADLWQFDHMTVIADDPPADPDPLPDPGPDGPGVPGDERPRAVSAQSIAIEAKLTTCPSCQGIHHPQACPDIRARLFSPAPWSDPALGRELCRMKWRDFKGFVTLLREVRGHGHLVVYAASYQAFIQSHRPGSDLTITQVLAAWAREMSGEPMPRLEVA